MKAVESRTEIYLMATVVLRSDAQMAEMISGESPEILWRIA